jgi:hypothetical protein
VNPSLLTTQNNPTAVALNATHVFWTNDGPSSADEKIGRATLAGAGINHDFIVGAESPLGLAVDDFPHSSSTVVACLPTGVAVTQPATCTATVSETAVTGAAAVPAGTVTFSSGGGSFQPGAACSLAPVGGTQSSCTATFVAAQTGSQTIDASYAGPGLHDPSGGSATVEAAVLELGQVSKDRKHGTAKLTVRVPGPGSVALAGKGLKPKAADTAAAGEVELKLKAKGDKKEDLKRKGKVNVKPEVTFTPSGGGDADTEKTKTKLVKR